MLLFAANGDRKTQKKLTVIRTLREKSGIRRWDPKESIETQTDTRVFDSNSRSSRLTLTQKVHGSFAFWPCSGKVEALLREQKGGIGIWDPKEIYGSFAFLALFWKGRGTFEKKWWHSNVGPKREWRHTQARLIVILVLSSANIELEGTWFLGLLGLFCLSLSSENTTLLKTKDGSGL